MAKNAKILYWYYCTYMCNTSHVTVPAVVSAPQHSKIAANFFLFANSFTDVFFKLFHIATEMKWTQCHVTFCIAPSYAFVCTVVYIRIYCTAYVEWKLIPASIWKSNGAPRIVCSGSTLGWVDFGTGTKVPLRFVTYLSKVT
jgi:hypothetical protein